jgi:hypothetical protein
METTTIFYGPHQCNMCGDWIVKAAREQGGAEFDWPKEGPYPNTQWVAHVHAQASDGPKPAEPYPTNARV